MLTMLYAALVILASSLALSHAQAAQPGVCPAITKCQSDTASRDPAQCRADAAKAKACVEGVITSSDICDCDVNTLTGIVMSMDQRADMCDRAACRSADVANCVRNYQTAHMQNDQSAAAVAAECLPKQPLTSLFCFGLTGPVAMSDTMKELARSVTVKTIQAVARGCNLNQIARPCQGPVMRTAMFDPCSVGGKLEGMRQCITGNLQNAGEECGGLDGSVVDDSITLIRHMADSLCKKQQQVKDGMDNCVKRSAHAQGYRRSFPFF